MGAFVVFTAVVILIPLTAEVREADRNLRELVSPALLAFGLLLAGLGLWFAPVERQGVVAGFGVVMSCLGLLIRPSGVASGSPIQPAPPAPAPAVQKGSST